MQADGAAAAISNVRPPLPRGFCHGISEVLMGSHKLAHRADIWQGERSRFGPTRGMAVTYSVEAAAVRRETDGQPVVLIVMFAHARRGPSHQKQFPQGLVMETHHAARASLRDARKRQPPACQSGRGFAAANEAKNLFDVCAQTPQQQLDEELRIAHAGIPPPSPTPPRDFVDAGKRFPPSRGRQRLRNGLGEGTSGPSRF